MATLSQWAGAILKLIYKETRQFAGVVEFLAVKT